MERGDVDIELPMPGRRGDLPADAMRVPKPTTGLAGPGADPPFPIGLLLAAPAGPYALTVETKHDDRVVGTWRIECNPGAETGQVVSHVGADLYVCGSASGNPRETGGFLAISDWWVDAHDPQRLAHLYAALSGATIDRLLSLLVDHDAGKAGAHPLFVLYLVDVRRRDRRALDLSLLEAELLLELADGRAPNGIDLRVAHGRGLGASPIFDTTPAPMGHSTHRAAVGEGFVREVVSVANLKWNRRATDRSALLAFEEDERGAVVML